MRIHTITNSYSMHQGGAEKLALQLHHALLERGMDAHICGLFQNDPNIQCAEDLKGASPYSWKAFWGLVRYCRSISKEDAVHIHLFPTLFYCAVLRRLGLLKGYLIFTEHNTHNRRRNKWWGRWLDRWMYRSLDKVVAISEATADELTNWLPFLTEHTTVIHNGIELIHTQPYPHVEHEVFRIVSVGNLRTQKNYLIALEAIAQLNQHRFSWEIAGEGSLRPEIEEKIRDLELSSSVRLLGHVVDVPRLLEGADLFFLPSLWEGFGLAVVEAMDASLPLAVSRVNGLNEVVGEAAIRFNPEDPEDMADALRKMIDDKELRRSLAKASFERSRRFGFSTMFEAYLKLYQAS